MRVRHFGLLNTLVLTLTGCAGPATPFGAVDLFNGKAGWAFSWQKPDAENDEVKISFSPARQVLHGSTKFSVIIEDPRGVPDDYELYLTYNGIDISEKFRSRAVEAPLDPLRKRVKLTTKTLRLIPTRENVVKFAYRRGANNEDLETGLIRGIASVEGPKTYFAEYLPPRCSVFGEVQPLYNIPGFRASRAMVQLINRYASAKNINPSYVGGLIAQESGFNPSAVSSAKALGLTQITSLGAAEVTRNYSAWPRHPSLDEMSVSMLRFAIMNGEVNSQNEWRLDPSLSIQGGVDYLTYLSDYWRRPDKRDLINRTLGSSDAAFGEVILASYNSGAARVSQALEKRGSEWLQEDGLSEAHKYVRKVVSYCDYFANGTNEEQ